MLSRQILKLLEDASEPWLSYLDDKPKTREYVVKAIEDLDAGLENKVIWNTEFLNIKSRLGSLCYDLFHDVKRDAIKKVTMTPEELAYFEEKIYMLAVQAPRMILKKIGSDNNPGLKFMVETLIKPIADLLEKINKLKEFVQKGRKPNPNAKTKPVFDPGYSSKEDTEKVKNIYEELLKEWLPKQIAEIEDQQEKMIVDLQKLLRDGTPAEKSNKRSHPGRIYFDLSDRLEKDYKKKIKEKAVKEAKAIQEAFTIKNIKKVTSIISNKGDLKDSKIVKTSSRDGIMEGIIKFLFSDGSSFSVKNQVVVVWDTRKPFYRFPTTFIDIEMPDKVKHKMKSEEWMNINFKRVA